jgi:hypothetical protein
MMEWTDRHCRFFHRLMTRHALLYTEMVTTGAMLHGNRAELIGFDRFEHPVALQLGGSDPRALAQCAPQRRPGERRRLHSAKALRASCSMPMRHLTVTGTHTLAFMAATPASLRIWAMTRSISMSGARRIGCRRAASAPA